MVKIGYHFFTKVQDGKLLLFIFVNDGIFAFILIKSIEDSQEIKEARGFLVLTLSGIINNYGRYELAHVYLRVPSVLPSSLF